MIESLRMLPGVLNNGCCADEEPSSISLARRCCRALPLRMLPRQKWKGFMSPRKTKPHSRSRKSCRMLSKSRDDRQPIQLRNHHGITQQESRLNCRRSSVDLLKTFSLQIHSHPAAFSAFTCAVRSCALLGSARNRSSPFRAPI
jgi:hypothetical protein